MSGAGKVDDDRDDHILYRIEAPHFVAGVTTFDGIVVRTAPITRYMKGWGLGRVKAYCAKKGWKLD